jgi:hypothetical protein
MNQRHCERQGGAIGQILVDDFVPMPTDSLLLSACLKPFLFDFGKHPESFG